MGAGAVFILLIIASLALYRANRLLEANETLAAILQGIFFTIDVMILVSGNLLFWGVWTLLGALKMIALPGREAEDASTIAPLWVQCLNVAMSAAVSAAIFSLFQRLR